MNRRLNLRQNLNNSNIFTALKKSMYQIMYVFISIYQFTM